MPNNLRLLRKARNWTQVEAATALGTTRNQYIKLEKGDRRLTLDWISRAAAAFGVDEAAILRGDDPPIVGVLNGDDVEWSKGEPEPGGRQMALVVTRASSLLEGSRAIFVHERRPPTLQDNGRVILAQPVGRSPMIGRILTEGGAKLAVVHLITSQIQPQLRLEMSWISPVKGFVL